MKFKLFDRNDLILKPLEERKNDINISIISNLIFTALSDIDPKIMEVAKDILNAKAGNKSIILFMGAHVIRAGVQKYLIDLMKNGYISCLSMNGGGIIHDFELAMIGATTESVSNYIKKGEFGLWKETSLINDIVNKSYSENPKIGLGEAIGKAIAESEYPFKSISLIANAYNLNVDVTVHVGIGYDIINEHPNFDGASTGALSYNDFLKITEAIQNLENGVLMNFGSAIMAPEVFLKALSMARNTAQQRGEHIAHFTTLVCDLHDLPENIRLEPPKNSAAYFFRPWKTMLVRTVSEGGKSYYLKGNHSETIPALWSALKHLDNI
jgi:hypothetical protein